MCGGDCQAKSAREGAAGDNGIGSDCLSVTMIVAATARRRSWGRWGGRGGEGEELPLGLVRKESFD